MRTYRLMVSQTFPCTHSRAGESTGFPKKLKDGRKLHTIRGNAEWWEQVAKEINAGDAVLSVRVWNGRPYRSKQTEIMQVTKLGTQRISMSCDDTCPMPAPYIDGKKVDVFALAANDGLVIYDFLEWFFPNGSGVFDGVVLHFTDKRY